METIIGVVSKDEPRKEKEKLIMIQAITKTGGRASREIFSLALTVVLVAAALVLLASPPALAATSVVQDTDREHTQYGTWTFNETPGASGGWTASTRTAGSTADLKFRGTRVAWKTITYEGGGITDVFLDNKKVSSFDGYSTGDPQFDVTGFSKRGLSDRRHTLSLLATGTKRPGTSGDVFSIVDRFVVGSTTIEENSLKVAYDGWAGKANSRASGGTYRQGSSQSLGATCGLFRGPQIDLITAKGPARGMARVRVQDISTQTWVKDFTVDLHSSKVEWQHHVPVTGLDQNKLHKLEVTSVDGTPVVFDGCEGTFVGPLN